MGIESLRGAVHNFPLLTRLSTARSTSKRQSAIRTLCKQTRCRVWMLYKQRSAYHQTETKRRAFPHAERQNSILDTHTSISLRPVHVLTFVMLSHTRAGRGRRLFPRRLTGSGSLPTLRFIVRHGYQLDDNGFRGKPEKGSGQEDRGRETVEGKPGSL